MGIHIKNQRKSSRFIVYNGRTDYRVVFPAKANAWEKTAVEELVFFFEKATGIKLQTVADSELSYRPELRLLIVGNTNMFERAKIFEGRFSVETEKLKSCGARVVSHGNSVFMYGATGLGTLYATYEFLQATLNFDYFVKDIYALDTNVTELPFCELDITEVPDIETRLASYKYVSSDSHYFRYRMQRDCIIPIEGKIGHNARAFLNASENKTLHPLWFDDDKKPFQPCFTAHGDEKEYAAMLDFAFEKLKKGLVEYPDRNIVRFATEDDEKSCACPTCAKSKKKYGTDSAAEIVFLNALKGKADEWFESEEGKPYRRDLKLVFYAYLNYLNAPASKDKATGEYKAKDEKVVCKKGVVPILCPIEATYSKSMYHEANAKWREIADAWSACADDIHFYFYDTNYHYMLTPYDTFSSMRENYKFIAKYNSSFFNNLGQLQNKTPTGFSMLKVYLESKLGWNVEADVDEYTNKFFANVYGAGGEDMKKLYLSYREQAKKVHGELKYGEHRNCECFADPLQRKFWDKQILEEWDGYAKSALKKLGALTETDFPAYVLFAKNILAERVFVRYLLVELYGEEYDTQTLKDMKLSVKKDCEFIGLTNYNEMNNVDLWKLWGV